MKTYNVINAVLIPPTEGKNEEPYFQLNLANDKGIPLTVQDDDNPEVIMNAPIVMSMAHLDAQLRNFLGVQDVDFIAPFEKISLLRTMSLTANVEKKEKGSKFVASENTKSAFDGKKWLNASEIKAGAEYVIARTNWRIDYDKTVLYNFDQELGFKVSDRILARQLAQKEA